MFYIPPCFNTGVWKRFTHTCKVGTFLTKNGVKQPSLKFKTLSVALLPSSFAVISVSSCKSWSTHGLKSAFDVPSVFPAEVEVVSVDREFSSMKPITKHKITARIGVRTDRRAMAAGEERRGEGALPCRPVCLNWELQICCHDYLYVWTFGHPVQSLNTAYCTHVSYTEEYGVIKCHKVHHILHCIVFCNMCHDILHPYNQAYAKHFHTVFMC